MLYFIYINFNKNEINKSCVTIIMVKLEQTKLTKDEWLSIEVPISEYEMKIVELINNSNKDIINYT